MADTITLTINGEWVKVEEQFRDLDVIKVPPRNSWPNRHQARL